MRAAGVDPLARWLVTVPALFTAISPLVADLGSAHLENPAWPAHARYHGVLLICAMVGVGTMSIVLLWRPFPQAERKIRVTVAALLPSIIWASFVIALLVPGTSSWPDGAARPLPVAPNVMLGIVAVALSLAGLVRDRRQTQTG